MTRRMLGDSDGGGVAFRVGMLAGSFTRGRSAIGFLWSAVIFEICIWFYFKREVVL